MSLILTFFSEYRKIDLVLLIQEHSGCLVPGAEYTRTYGGCKIIFILNIQKGYSKIISMLLRILSSLAERKISLSFQ